MKEAFVGKNVELSYLPDFINLEAAPETGNTALENAISKAKFYYAILKIPLFSCDTALEIENLPEHLKPGVHVRRVNGKNLTDEEMIVYYGELAKKFGKLKCRYRNAVCLILSDHEIVASDHDTLSSSYFYIHEKPVRPTDPIKGFPLDCLSDQSSENTPMINFVDFIIKNICS